MLGLKHPHEGTRQRAALALGPLVRPELAGRLAAHLWSEPDFFVRETLTWLLTRIPRQALAEALGALCDERSQVRHDAVHLIGKIADPSAVSAVLPLTADADDAVAAKARFVLTRLGDPSAIPALTAYLGRGDDAQRTALTRDLASFGEAALPHLHHALGHGAPRVREHAEWVLEVIREQQDGTGEDSRLTLTRRQASRSETC